jgi:hypothetical protein
MLPDLGSAVEGTASGEVDLVATALSIDSLPEDDGAVPHFDVELAREDDRQCPGANASQITGGVHDQDILIVHLYEDTG